MHQDRCLYVLLTSSALSEYQQLQWFGLSTQAYGLIMRALSFVAISGV